MRTNLSLRLLLADKDKEIEQLKKELTEEKNAYIKMYNMYVEKDNIINELNDMFYETFRISQNGYYSISEWELKEFTDKIKELKGSDKE